MRRHHVALVGLFVLVPGAAFADWPMVRHDAKRTASATGTADLSKPTPFFRAFLGGRLTGLGMMRIGDAPDGKAQVALVAGGRLLAKKADGSVSWQTTSLGLGALGGVDDFDGDGVLDVVAYSDDRAYIFNARTGALEWAEAEGEMGTLGGIRIGDVDGDKKPELIVQECGCCGVNSGKTGFAYTFAAGFAAAKQLWSLPSVGCGGYQALTLFDADNDGTLEVTLATPNTMQIVDGKTGAVSATSPDLGGIRTPFAECMPANVDGLPGEELVCINRLAAAAPKGHRVFALKYSKGATPSLAVLWDRDIGDTDGKLVPASELTVDLDGDGKLEVVLSSDVAGSSTLFVLDAATGVTLAESASQRVVGVAPVRDSKKPSILTTSGGKLQVHSFVRGTPSTLKKELELDGTFATAAPDGQRLKRSFLNARTVATDLDGDGTAELVTYKGLPATEVVAYSLTGTTAKAVGSYVLPAATEPTATWVVDPFDRPFQQVVVARNDGVLQFLDKGLKSTTADGITFGGYHVPGAWRGFFAGPVVGSLDPAKKEQSVLVVDSRGALLRLDLKDATFTGGATPLWVRANTISPAVVPNLVGVGKPGIACRSVQTPVTDPIQYQVSALKPDGTAHWSTPVEGLVLSDVLPANLDGDAVPDLVFQWGKESDSLLLTRALKGTDGTALWTSTAVSPGSGRQVAGYAVGDWNGDKVDDVVYQAAALRVLDGKTGVETANGGSPFSYAMPILHDADGDGAPDVTLHGGFEAARTWKHDLSTTLWKGAEDNPYPYGSVVKCGGVDHFVGGSWKNRARLTSTATSGATVGEAKWLVLAGGVAYVDEAAAASAKAPIRQLTAANAHSNLDGTGAPSVAVGSADGFVYVVDPCAMKLRYAVDMGAPVGEVVFGDTDGDGKDEMLVSVADGYLYGLRNATLAAPKDVLDLEPGAPGTADVDITASGTSLMARWSAVEGADGYEVAVSLDGKYLTTPAWQSVGNVTQTTVSGLALVPGSKYLFGVRAKSATKGVSPDGVSDGVTYLPAGDAGVDAGETGPTDGGFDGGVVEAGSDGGATGGDGLEGGGGCGCRVSNATPAAPVALLTLALAALRRRRRSQPTAN